MQIDFNNLKTKIESATRKAFSEIIEEHGNEDIYAFALYSDEGAMTVCPSSNTLEYLQKADDEPEYYKFVPFEWKYEMKGAQEEFNTISRALWEYHDKVEMSDDEFDTFQSELYETCIDVLKKLKSEQFFKQIAGKDIFLTFEASEYEFEKEKTTQIITELNDNHYKEEYLNWMKTWG